ncbi:Gx transporter family protein [Eremococcus coleocola]|uniref:Gx transporter family protein n=1 Tax=Eremococcus coleocola TaxID=88132 RepID=UPI0004201809|nr:Gx transporter family protein [Eremococcus coleocola]
MLRSRYQILVYVAVLAAQAIIIGLLEQFIPSPFVFAPGAKIGLANIITVIAIFTLPYTQSFQVLVIRIFLTALLGGNMSTFFYSAVAGFLSYIFMCLAQLLGPKRVSIIGISILGGVMHNVGQLFVAAFFAKSWSVLNYLPVLSFSGILAGLAVGTLGNYLLTRVASLRLYHQELVLSQAKQNWLEFK